MCAGRARGTELKPDGIPARWKRGPLEVKENLFLVCAPVRGWQQAQAGGGQRLSEAAATSAAYVACVAMSEAAYGSLHWTNASVLLIQRARLGEGVTNEKHGTAAPLVTDALAHSTDLPVLCHALAALST